VKGLLSHNPAARITDIDVHIYMNEQQFSRIFQAQEGYRILEGKLGYFDYNMNQWTWIFVEGAPVEIYVSP